MYVLIILIWSIAIYIGFSILFNKIICLNLLKKLFDTKLLKRVLHIKLIQSIFLRIERIFKAVPLEIKAFLRERLAHLFFYTLSLLLIAYFSLWLLPENQPPQWMSKIIIPLGAIAIIIIPILLIVSIVEFFIKSVGTISNDIMILKQEMKYLIGLKMFIKILVIMISPAIIFSFIYGLTVFINGFPDLIGELITMNNFIYSMSVSFPIPIEGNLDQKTAWWKYISFMQVIIQRIIEIGVLGYIINIFHETFKSNDTSKNNSISSDEVN